ncbi:MAG: hypothetical protein ACHQ5A_10540 [Opitutales bacterium]
MLPGAESTPAMSEPADPVLPREVPIIAHLIHHEISLEAERRGCPVAPDDPVVRERVCESVLRIGAELRDALSRPG